MSDRSERFKKRQSLRNKSSLQEVHSGVDEKRINSLLSGDIDNDFLEFSSQGRANFQLQVSEDEVKSSLSLIERKMTKDKYNALFEGGKEVLIDQLLSSLKLSRSDIQSADRDFLYKRDEYTKSPKSVGGDGPAFATVREKAKAEATVNGKIKDTYTGESHSESVMDFDHVKSLKEFHDEGGFMLSRREQREFAADSNNHEFTHQSINRSKNDKNIKDFSENGTVDKRRTNAAHKRAEQAAEKYVPSGKVDKTVFVVERAAADGLSVGKEQGLQQAVAALISELISATFREVKDILDNGWNNQKYDLSWIEVLKNRLLNIKDYLVLKWKNVASAFGVGAISGFLSAIITAVLNMFIRTGKNLVRIMREGFLSLAKAIQTLILPPEGMTAMEAAHAATKVLASGLVVTGGILAGEAIAAAMPPFPFAGAIAAVIAGMLSGLGSLFVVFMLDKLDLFGVEEAERHLFIMGEIESKIDLHSEEMESIIDRLGLSTPALSN